MIYLDCSPIILYICTFKVEQNKFNAEKLKHRNGQIMNIQGKIEHSITLIQRTEKLALVMSDKGFLKIKTMGKEQKIEELEKRLDMLKFLRRISACKIDSIEYEWEMDRVNERLKQLSYKKEQ